MYKINMREEQKEKKFALPNTDTIIKILEKSKTSPFNEIGGTLTNPEYSLYERLRKFATVLEVKDTEIKKYYKSKDRDFYKKGIPLGEPDEILISKAGEICGGHDRQVFKDSIDLISQYLKKGYELSYIYLEAEKSVFEMDSLAHISFDKRATEIRYNAEFEEKIAPVLELIEASVPLL
ncbi:MAG: hypothetical protein WA139_00855 [Candidatus Aenigmatarchaeota archaeon]